jgi:hypothetical protein
MRMKNWSERTHNIQILALGVLLLLNIDVTYIANLTSVGRERCSRENCSFLFRDFLQPVHLVVCFSFGSSSGIRFSFFGAFAAQAGLLHYHKNIILIEIKNLTAYLHYRLHVSAAVEGQSCVFHRVLETESVPWRKKNDLNAKAKNP